MITRTKKLVLLAALGLLASACSAASYAATVDGTHISDDEVLAVLGADPEGTTGGEPFRGALSSLIVMRATSVAAEEQFGLADLESDEVRQAFLASARPEDLAQVNAVAARPDLGPYAADVVATHLAIQRAVESQIANDLEFQQSVWDNDRDLLINVCPRHIVVATEEEAEAAKARVEAGEDFGAVVEDVSLDQQSPGGALPCPESPARYVDPFRTLVATAPVGEVAGPIETGFGWHIVIVDARDEPEDFDAFAADPLRWLPPDLLGTEYSIWRDAVVDQANIAVRSQIGTWFPQADAILKPPDSP